MEKAAKVFKDVFGDLVVDVRRCGYVDLVNACQESDRIGQESQLFGGKEQ